MKKSYYVILGVLICLVVAASGCVNQGNQSGNQSTGSANQTNVQGVTSVVLNGPGTLIIQQGDKDSFTIEADSSMMSKINTQVSGNALVINNLNSASNGAVKFKLTLKSLDSVALHGNCEGNVTGLSTSKLTSTVDAGTLYLAGTSTDHTATVNGAGSINAHDLKTQTATVTINGGGSAIVNVATTLNAIVNGGGSIKYLGNPTLNKQINGMGTVTPTS
ncbi:GIN domain-containing protein [Methanobacterium congolense]|mgnify:FL=1|uniref:Putative auto-transporter adhesin head GIN domain-containing protein n=1 Tax=Methanobacterium congolense TaxID=118062 RepID=A0A1D3L2S3_9EURY|nr:DUF2807 domain-containing protein [Methanobacterium congolense]SCG85887.1 putative protein [Methanobacterium congolense]